jgi:hypothetical protein
MSHVERQNAWSCLQKEVEWLMSENSQNQDLLTKICQWYRSILNSSEAGQYVPAESLQTSSDWLDKMSQDLSQLKKTTDQEKELASIKEQLTLWRCGEKCCGNTSHLLSKHVLIRDQVSYSPAPHTVLQIKKFTYKQDQSEKDHTQLPAAFFQSSDLGKLVGGIVHRGSSPQNGHYKAYVEVDRKWYCCDDDCIEQVSFPQQDLVNAYILFYQK